MYFFVKHDLPEDETSEETIHLIQNLAKVGLDIDVYTAAFNITNSQRLELWNAILNSMHVAVTCLGSQYSLQTDSVHWQIALTKLLVYFYQIANVEVCYKTTWTSIVTQIFFIHFLFCFVYCWQYYFTLL